MSRQRVNYMSDDTYKHEHRNPAGDDGQYLLPDKRLRQIYKNNNVRPIAIAQRLTHRGALPVEAIALSYSDNEAEQRNKDFWELLAPLRGSAGQDLRALAHSTFSRPSDPVRRTLSTGVYWWCPECITEYSPKAPQNPPYSPRRQR